jgi:hypothetical protein
MVDLRQEPKTSDGKRIILNAKYRGDWQQWFPGAGDASGKGDGPLFGITQTTQGLSSMFEWQWNDPVYLGGGQVMYKDAAFGDYVTFKFLAPATPVVANAGNGNVNLSPYGPGNLIVPAPATDGSHDVDLTAVTGTAIPVPDSNQGTENQAGYWNYPNPDEGKADITAVANPASPDGGWHLFDFEATLVNYLPKAPLLGSGVLNFAVDVNPKRLLPHWKACVQLYNTDGSHTVEVCWVLETARKTT